MFSQKPKLIRSVASDGLTNIYNRRVSLNIIQTGRKKFGRKIGFKIENEGEDQNQSCPKLIGILTVLRCIFGPNLVILAWTADDLWGGQAQNEVKFDFQVKFDLEGQGRSSPKTIGTLTKVFCTFVPNLVILAWTSGELSCGQARHWHTHTRTHGHTDAGNDNTRRPKLASGKNLAIFQVAQDQKSCCPHALSSWPGLLGSSCSWRC